MSEQNYLRADTLTRRAGDPGNDTLRFAILQAFKTRDMDAYAQLTDAYVEKPDAYMRVAMDLAVTDANEAAALGRRILDRRKQGAMMGPGRRSMAVLHAERGRYREAYTELTAPGNDEASIDTEVAIAILPLAPQSPERLQQLYQKVLQTDSLPGTSDDPRQQLRPQFRAYNLALLSCRMGRVPQALALAARIEALPVPSYWRAAMSALATDVRAHADITNGNLKSALARLESITTDPPLDLLTTPAERLPQLLWQAELLYLNGRSDEALAWFENVRHVTQYEVPVYTYTTLRRAELLDRAGRTRDAVPLYAQVLNNWKDSDPELRPVVNYVRDRLSRLQSATN